MGYKLITVQNLEVVEINLDKNIILVKGNVPGPKKSLVIIKSAIKHEGQVNEIDELVTYAEATVEETPVEEVVETTETTEETPVEETPVVEETTAEATEETTTEESSQE